MEGDSTAEIRYGAGLRLHGGPPPTRRGDGQGGLGRGGARNGGGGGGGGRGARGGGGGGGGGRAGAGRGGGRRAGKGGAAPRAADVTHLRRRAREPALEVVARARSIRRQQ